MAAGRDDGSRIPDEIPGTSVRYCPDEAQNTLIKGLPPTVCRSSFDAEEHHLASTAGGVAHKSESAVNPAEGSRAPLDFPHRSGLCSRGRI